MKRKKKYNNFTGAFADAVKYTISNDLELKTKFLKDNSNIKITGPELLFFLTGDYQTFVNKWLTNNSNEVLNG